MKGIADTGFIVAFANRNDLHHRWAVEVAGQVTEPLMTCEAVLAESAFHLRSAETVLALVQNGLLVLAFDAGKHIAELEFLSKRYAGRQPGFADLCLIRMSELHPRRCVVTIDRDDFRIYRRNRREVIPLICPAGTD